MKILLPYVDVAGNDITSGVISGGTELFSRLVYQNFDVEVFPIPWNTDNEQNKRIISKMRGVIEDKKIDLILSNNIKSVCCYAIRDIGVPILHITHTNYGLINSNITLNRMIAAGHSIYGVSQNNIDWLNEKSVRLGEPGIEFSGIIKPAYCLTDLTVNTVPYKQVVTVGRSNTYKAPFFIHGRFGDYKTVVITSKGVDHDSVDYYESNKHKPHLLDLPHAEVMQQLRNSTASVITCTKETFGITALESLSVGTPVLIRKLTTADHASTEIPASPDHYRAFDKTDDLQKLLFELEKADRIEIKQMTQAKHSRENWVRTLSNAFDKTIEFYKKTRAPTSDLAEFFG